MYCEMPDHLNGIQCLVVITIMEETVLREEGVSWSVLCTNSEDWKLYVSASR